MSLGKKTDCLPVAGPPRWCAPTPILRERLLPAIPAEFVPQHVAIVMDGNGRWANQRGLPRIEGHKAGEPALLDVVAGAIELGIKYVTRLCILHGELAAVPGGSAVPDGIQQGRAAEAAEPAGRMGRAGPLVRPAAQAVGFRHPRTRGGRGATPPETALHA